MKKKFVLLLTMLVVSIFLVTAAGFAWFTTAAEVRVNGTNVKAETEGFLKVWTPNNSGLTNFYANYVTYIDFSDDGDANDHNLDGLPDPFYNVAYTNHVMQDQSGNGKTFYNTIGVGSAVNYAVVANFGCALVYDLYFSSYTGSSIPNDMRDVYLTEINIFNENPPKDPDLADSIRVAFLDSSDRIFGIYNTNVSDAFVTSTDYAAGSGSPIDGTPSGRIVSSTAFGTTSYTDYNSTVYDENIPENTYIEPASQTSTVIRRINVESTICQVNASEISGKLVRVVIWFEGSDGNTSDAVLGQEVNIDMTFAARMPADVYSVSYSNDGGTHSNPQLIELSSFVSGTNSDAYLLTAATKPGHTFGGWYTDSGLTVQLPTYDDGGVTKWQLKVLNFSQNLATLYAKWTLN